MLHLFFKILAVALLFYAPGVLLALRLHAAQKQEIRLDPRPKDLDGRPIRTRRIRP